MKKTTYLVYRHGSNANNQSMCDRAPVALVEASSREEACRTEAPERPTIADCAWLAADSRVTCWANQYFSAVPASKAPRADVRALEEVPFEE